MRPSARSLVRIRDGATVLEPPLAGGRNSPVDTARAGGGRRHDAAVRRIEMIRHLHHHGDAFAAVAVSLEGNVLVAGDQPFAAGWNSVHRDVRAVKQAVTTAGCWINESAIIRVDREATQLLRGRLERIGEA